MKILLLILTLLVATGEYRTNNAIVPHNKYTLWTQIGPGTDFDYEVIDAYASYKRVIYASNSKAEAERFIDAANVEYVKNPGSFPKFFVTSVGKADDHLTQLKEKPQGLLKLQKSGNVILVPPNHRLVWQQRDASEKAFAIGLIHFQKLGMQDYYNNSPVRLPKAFQR